MPVTLDAARGDLAEDADAAMRQLYDRYASTLYRYVERWSPDFAGTEDIVQETFIRAWRHLPQLLADERMVRPWLLRVARNLLTDAARAAQSRPVTVAARLDLDLTDDGQFDQVDQVADRQLMADALRNLSPAHQAVLVETFYRGGSTAMIARQLGIPHGTARSRLHYALLALRRELQDPARPQPGQAAA